MAIGLDVHCYYQRTIRWDQVNGVYYVWVKTTDGGRRYTKTVNGVTYYPATMVNGAKSRKIPVGGYCYGQPGDGGAHADVLIDQNAELGATGLWPAMDIESNKDIHIWGTQEAIDYGRAFSSRVIRRGMKPVIYMDNATASTTRPDTWPEKPVLWIARYGARPSAPHDVHQYTQSGAIAGTTSDMNESYNDKHFATQTVAPPKKPLQENEMITFPTSTDETGRPGMPPTPIIALPGEGKVRLLLLATTDTVFLGHGRQYAGWRIAGDNAEEPYGLDLPLPDRLYPNQPMTAEVHMDALSAKIPYSTNGQFIVSVQRMS